MRPLGKTMKINHYHRKPESEALQQLIQNYRDSPHASTGIPPSAMMCCDGQHYLFPRKTVIDKQVQEGRKYDEAEKQSREEVVNSSKYRKPAEISTGDSYDS